MFTSLPRLSLFLTGMLTVSVGSAQPPANDEKKEITPDLKLFYTAFPDLKPAPFDPEAELLAPALPELPANAPLLHKVQREQAQQGFNYLNRIRAIIKEGKWSSDNFDTTLFMVGAVYPLTGELEDELANRIPWYEERIRKLKEFERFIEIRVEVKSDPPDYLLFARFTRLGAEADLLHLQAEVAKSGGKVERSLLMKKAEIAYPQPRKGEPFGVEFPAVYTAFPNLKAPTYERKKVTKPDGTIDIIEEEKGYVPLPRLPALPPGASTLHKVRHEQALERFLYLRNGLVRIPLSLHIPEFSYPRFWIVLANAYQKAADLETQPADRIPWYEGQVRDLKRLERFVTIRVEVGATPAQDLDVIHYLRLRAEADLIRLKEGVEKAGPATGPEPIREKLPFKLEWEADSQKPRPHHTAFPDLKPRTIEAVEVKDAEGKSQRTDREKGVVPLPPRPIVSADAPLVYKVRFAQLQVGFAYLDMLRERVLRGTYTPDVLIQYVHMATEVYRVALELEETRAKWVPWYEARVRTLKDIEQFIEMRVGSGSEPSHALNRVRVARLQAEVELLILKTEPEPILPSVCPVPNPPLYVQPRARLLPRLFRR